ncbi:MAG: endonuclease, partial [Bacteroidales bacterium]|nr:endonuclease [Bacteroidales bacterium]
TNSKKPVISMENICKAIAFFLLFATSTAAYSQTPEGYYDETRNLCGEDLRQKLHSIISPHTTLAYSDLWEAYEQTDTRENGDIWDIYSDCAFTFGDDQCGNYSSECMCYNREHLVPQSWFNEASPMKTDLFHVCPTDGWVNNKRGNLPLGEVSSPTYTSGNGSKVGPCSFVGYSGTVFEPVDEYKGDIARAYFYMSTCYSNKNLGCTTESMFQGSEIKEWAMNMLLEWHRNDPVSQKEIDRNNAVFAIQNNRNPFIDCPYFVDAIWSNQCDFDICLSDLSATDSQNIQAEVNISPNPASEYVEISYENAISGITIINILGEKLLETKIGEKSTVLNIENYISDTYFLRIETEDNKITTKKLIIY